MRTNNSFNKFLGLFNFAGGIIILSKTPNGISWDITGGIAVLTIGCLLLTFHNDNP